MVIGADQIGYNNIKADSNTSETTIIEIEAYSNQLQYKMVIWADWISYNTRYKVLAIGTDVHISYNRS